MRIAYIEPSPQPGDDSGARNRPSVPDVGGDGSRDDSTPTPPHEPPRGAPRLQTNQPTTREALRVRSRSSALARLSPSRACVEVGVKRVSSRLPASLIDDAAPVSCNVGHRWTSAETR